MISKSNHSNDEPPRTRRFCGVVGGVEFYVGRGEATDAGEWVDGEAGRDRGQQVPATHILRFKVSVSLDIQPTCKRRLLF